MKTRISPIKLNKIQITNTLLTIFVFALTIAVGLIILFYSKPTPYNIVELKGKNDASYNFSKYWGYSLGSDSGHSTSMLVERGDIITLGKDEGKLVRYSTEKTLNFKDADPFFYINGQIVSIAISKKHDLIPWFKQMKESDIAGLQSLSVTCDTIPSSYIPYLQKIAKTKPKLGLIINNIKQKEEICKIFAPIWLMGFPISQKDYTKITDLKELEILAIELEDSIITTPLPFLPKLKQVIIYNIKSITIGNQLFKNNTQIERLVLACNDIASINSLLNLKELTLINGNEKQANLDSLAVFKNMEVLRLIGNYQNIRAINKFNRLRWLALPANTNQHDFNAIIFAQKNLEVLEVLKGSTIKNYISLGTLKNLYGLIITDTLADRSTLKSLKTLKYLTIPSKEYKDSSQTAALQQSLPGCIIVPNDGFCLGSGWLLLLIPLVLLLGYIIRFNRAS